MRSGKCLKKLVKEERKCLRLIGRCLSLLSELKRCSGLTSKDQVKACCQGLSWTQVLDRVHLGANLAYISEGACCCIKDQYGQHVHLGSILSRAWRANEY